MRGDREEEIVPKVGGGGYLSRAAVLELVDLDLIPENGVGNLAYLTDKHVWLSSGWGV